MEQFLSEHWKLAGSVIVVAVCVGVAMAVSLREMLRKWLLSTNGSIMVGCPLAGKNATPMSKEEHDHGCNHRWLEHEKASEGRWKFNATIAAKDRELVLDQIATLKTGQDKMSKTIEKIFDRLERMKP